MPPFLAAPRALQYFINNPLVAIPGTVYAYSSFGINLAAVVLEHATGKSFAALVNERIARPLGMCSLQPDYEWVYNPNRAAGFDTAGNNVGSSDVSWRLASGGFMSTYDDFLRYGQVRISRSSSRPRWPKRGGPCMCIRSTPLPRDRDWPRVPRTSPSPLIRVVGPPHRRS